MKKIYFILLSGLFSFNVLAKDDFSVSEAPLVESLPTNELEFVDTIGLLRPDEVSKN